MQKGLKNSSKCHYMQVTRKQLQRAWLSWFWFRDLLSNSVDILLLLTNESSLTTGIINNIGIRVPYKPTKDLFLNLRLHSGVLVKRALRVARAIRLAVPSTLFSINTIHDEVFNSDFTSHCNSSSSSLSGKSHSSDQEFVL